MGILKWIMVMDGERVGGVEFNMTLRAMGLKWRWVLLLMSDI